LNSSSYFPAVSDDGRYVAFATGASNASPAYPELDIDAIPDANVDNDVYVLDKENDSLLRATYNYDTGAEPNGDMGFPIDISADGRYVVYQSLATNLGPSDTNGVGDIYRFDQLNGENRLVSLSSSGVQANAGSGYPSISADGNIVAFQSDAWNLVPADTNSRPDIFVRDITAGTTTRVSVDSTGAEASYGSSNPYISANGRFVAFTTLSQLVPEDGNLSSDVYLRDLQTGQTSRVSVSVTGGDPTGGYSAPTDISADGRYVVFDSVATNLVSGDQNGQSDVFVRDRSLGMTLRASVGSGGGGGNDWSDDGRITSDGHYVAFVSQATNLWPTTDMNGSVADVFEFDVWANALAGHLSVGPGDVWANGWSDEVAISGDGLYVAYHSNATNLMGVDAFGGYLDTNGFGDVFTHFWLDPGRTQCHTKRRSEPRPVPIPWAPMTPGGGSKPDYDRKCQDSVGTGTDPAPNLTEAQRYDPFDSFTATSSYQGINPVYLRWGRTNYNLLRGWLGWGYRKIKAKHGWSAAIRGRVAAALLTPDLLLQYGTRWVYQMNYVNKGTNCRILVSVQYTPQTFEQTHGYPAAHIVTVYAWKR
jgi:hypothetical protein